MQSRSFSWVAVLLLSLWLIFICLVLKGATDTLPAPRPLPLRAIPVPQPANLDQFVADRAAAIRLGKALFWDMQVGSDGIQACGSCHFQAGADPRLKNQLNPDLNGSRPTFSASGGPNVTLTAQDFPFRRLSDLADPNSVIDDRNDVVGSQGVFKTLFVDIVPGSAVDQVVQLPDPVFNVAGVKTRRVEPRNAPTVINAIFNHRNFWDGRAQSEFNGVNPFGSRDANARVMKVDLSTGVPSLVPTGITEGASLASLACGPALSANEMSADGRTLPKLGKKLLSLRPLAKQLVAIDDSTLGSLSSAGGGNDRSRTGLNTTYLAMIQAAFRPEWWQSQAVVTYDPSGSPLIKMPAAGVRIVGKRRGHGTGASGQQGGGSQEGSSSSGGSPPAGSSAGSAVALTTSQFSVTEANFSLFFGLAVQLYLSMLVSDDTPFDRFLGGNNDALTSEQQAGMDLFLGKAGCARCHVGSELTEASFAECYQERIDTLTSLSGVLTKYDKGFVNTGVRAVENDPGIAGTDPYGYPLSDSLRLQMGQLPTGTYNLDVGPQEPIAVAGAFKIPGLRNVELTAPYFHNGGMATLDQVVEFYNRGGDFSQQSPNVVRDFMKPLGLSDAEKAALVAFLKSLTDERVRFQRAPFDHPQILVPNGHPGDQHQVASDGTGKAQDALIDVPAVGAQGGQPSSPVF